VMARAHAKRITNAALIRPTHNRRASPITSHPSPWSLTVSAVLLSFKLAILHDVRVP
jgi:hypothetical protein